MEHRGSEFYDDALIFKKYLDRRSWTENANDTLEKPIILQLIGDVTGLEILDLGCGDASFGNELLDAGAVSYTGIEGSANMVEEAKKTMHRSKTEIIHTAIEDWDFPDSRFDMAISRLVLHYIEDVEAIFKKVYQSLVDGGSFIFSVEHPVMTSSYGLPREEGMKQDWIVDQYFHTGIRKQEWLGGTAVKYHRTIEDIYSALQHAGFNITRLRESKPDQANFQHNETYQRRMRIPLFLFFSAQKI
ncbi:methyltransferase domain-containing protein [Paenibacillus dokdonensis]|uniref:Methyltransferase domain-containing protein n=1 Tax=Paenibacillus dokdonensis TaxID=2567944 RepID=A0ABU6GMM1_9BACL|nr:methyltransferase domain-containing protein [Paenibacillus dokdonensis]MEC0240342.1 methyltransferase domain-containing protein [Paenibacillus dokdonensis]